MQAGQRQLVFECRCRCNFHYDTIDPGTEKVDDHKVVKYAGVVSDMISVVTLFYAR